jgi:MoxR-like ATPase
MKTFWDFQSVEQVEKLLNNVGYLPSEEISRIVFLASKLKKPILVEGPAGTGKTELAKSLATSTTSTLIRLQCYEGLDESKTLYEWNYKKQLLFIQAQNTGAEKTSWKTLQEDIFSQEFLLERPLLKAIRSQEQVVLLIDEIDRVETETEALMLEVLSDFQVSIPELGTLKAASMPFVVLTSNNTRELSEALKRRCLYLYLDYPDFDREKNIIKSKVPEVKNDLLEEIVKVVRLLRSMDLKKKPSVSETLDWARTLVVLGVRTLNDETTRETISLLLKYQEDIEKALKELKLT